MTAAPDTLTICKKHDLDNIMYGGCECDCVEHYVLKDIAERKVIDGLKRAKKSYDDKIENILQPIRDIKEHIVQDEIRNAIKETLRRVDE